MIRRSEEGILKFYLSAKMFHKLLWEVAEAVLGDEEEVSEDEEEEVCFR